MSGTEARELALNTDFDNWYSNIAPQDAPVNVKDQYKIAYDKIREAADVEPIEEISTTASAEGAVGAQGGPWNNREVDRDNEEEKKRSQLDMKGALIQQEAMIKEVMNYLLKDAGSSV